ncbi:MAG TPA: hypothetical protein DEP66_03025 [Acidimicrobiaceae bacterium]|nr:hypothetical protein [Acidimicrobiaceae bacterium]HCB37192.1 hypothetical protein [Acidimicrobiaceae bacterium]
MRLDDAGDIVAFESGLFPWEHFRTTGISFYVKEMPAAEHPDVENVAELVAGAARDQSRRHLVAEISVAALEANGFEPRLEATDEFELGFAHAVVADAAGEPAMSRAEFDDARTNLRPHFALAYGQSSWVKA